MSTDKILEQRLRRRLRRDYSCAMRKSRKPISLNNRGGYMIVDLSLNAVIAGEQYDLSLEDIEEWMKERDGTAKLK